MSVVTKNPFALLDEDDPNPPTPESAPPTTTAGEPPARGGPRGGRGGRGGPGSRGGKYYQRAGARTSAPREGAEDEGADDSAGKKVAFTDGDRGRGRRGRGRGERGGPRGDRDSFRGPRREHDRRSATGKTDSDKKIHQSWGGDEGQTELATETAAADDAAAEQTAPAEDAPTEDAPAEEWGATSSGDTWGATAGGDSWGGNTDWAAPPPAPDTNAEETTERSDRRPKDRQEEEQDNTLTLDQYHAQQKEKLALIPQLEIRKIEQDKSLWKGAKELVKGADEDTYFAGKAKPAHKARAKKEEKVYLEIDARFERPNRGGRGRGDRGGERGGRGTRGRGRGSRPNGDPLSVNVDDEVAFPSLS